MESLRQYRNFSHDQNFAVPQSDHIDRITLEAGIEKSHAKPTGANYVIINGTDTYYERMDGTATLPVADITDGSAAELEPGPRYIADVSTLSFIAPRACTITMAFYE